MRLDRFHDRIATSGQPQSLASHGDIFVGAVADVDPALSHGHVQEPRSHLDGKLCTDIGY